MNTTEYIFAKDYYLDILIENMDKMGKSEVLKFASSNGMVHKTMKNAIHDIKKKCFENKAFCKKLIVYSKKKPLLDAYTVENILRIDQYLRKRITDEGILSVSNYIRRRIHGREVDFPLYSLHDIILCLESKEFQVRCEEYLNRKLAGEKAVETKRDNLLKKIEEMNIYVEEMEESDLEEEAILHVNYFREGKGKKRNDFLYIDEDTRKRWICNYIRHELTNYDSEIEALVGKTGKNEAYKRLRERIKEAILKVYPFYEDNR